MMTSLTASRARVLSFTALMLIGTAFPVSAQQTGVLDPDVVAVLGRPDGAEEAVSPEVARRAKEIDSKLRCPVCQGVSIADSPSSMATNMREQVRSLVAAGYSDEQVLKYFENSYGEFVRLEPPLSGLNWLLWSMPVIALVLGAAGLFVRARRSPTASVSPAAVAEASPTAGTTPPVDPAVAKYLDRIRRDSGLSS